MSGNRLQADHGFSIAEIVWAALILFIVAMGVLGALTYAATSTSVSATRVTALNLANQRLEQARNLPYDSLGTRSPEGEYGDPPGTIVTPETVTTDDGRVFTVETDVRWARDPDTGLSLYKEVEVVVSWDEGPAGSLAVSTNVFGKTALVNTGDLEIEVRDLANDQAVSGAKVTVTPASGAARTVTTGTDGKAFYGRLPTGTYAVSILKTGYVFDTASPAGTVTVSSDLLSAVVAYVQAPSTLEVEVTRDGTAPLAGATLTLTRSGVAPRTATSDGNGRGLFTGLTVGTYQLRAEYAGRAPVQQSVSIPTPGETYSVVLTMPDRAGFVVRVVDGNGNPLPGASVALRGPAPSNGHVAGSPAVTASNGEVSFGVLADGTYQITASLAGFASVVQSVTYDGSVGLWEVTLSAAQPGSMTIHTVDRRGRSTANQTVYVDGPNYSRWHQTDWTGYLTITGLTPGTYTVTDRDTNRSYTVQVRPGENSYIEVRTD